MVWLLQQPKGLRHWPVYISKTMRKNLLIRKDFQILKRFLQPDKWFPKQYFFYLITVNFPIQWMLCLPEPFNSHAHSNETTNYKISALQAIKVANLSSQCFSPAITITLQRPLLFFTDFTKHPQKPTENWNSFRHIGRHEAHVRTHTHTHNMHTNTHTPTYTIQETRRRKQRWSTLLHCQKYNF